MQEGKELPLAVQDALIEEAEAAVADANGGGSELVDVFAVEQIADEFVFGDEIGPFAVEVGEQGDFADIGFDGGGTLAVEFECSRHLLTQWGHGIPPHNELNV